MKKGDNKLKELFQKMVSGAVSPDERALMAEWLDQLDADDGMDRQALDEWKMRSRAELRNAIKPPSRLKSWGRRATWMVGAAAALLVAVTVWKKPDRADAIAQPQATVYTEYSTLAGQRKRLTLSDGSTVWLGNASKIRYAKDFQMDRREVLLDGQAFFEVTPDAARPFHVQAGELDIRVLGTSFDVKSYAEDGAQKITVASGKVSVQPVHERQSWILEKGEQVVYQPADKKGRKQVVDVALVTRWKDGELVFRTEPLGVIAVQLERWYGVEIDIASASLSVQRLSLSVTDEPLQRVLDMLALAGNFRYEMQEKKITLFKRKGGR